MKRNVIIAFSIIFLSSIFSVVVLTSSGEEVEAGKESLQTEQPVLKCEDYKYEIYRLHRDYKEAIHQEVLLPDPRLEVAAQLKATEMIALNYWAHENPVTGEISTWKFIESQGYNRFHTGENLSMKNTPEQAMDQWLKSEKHLANIENTNYVDIGVYIDCDNKYKQGELLTVVVFGSEYEE